MRPAAVNQVVGPDVGADVGDSAALEPEENGVF